MSRLRDLGRGLDRLSPWIAIALIIIGFKAVHDQSARLNRDEAKTCVIQSRGLPASKHLANVMRDIAVFVEPPNPKNPLSRTLPKSPPVPEYYRAALADMRAELPEYNRLEGGQPSGRSC